MWVPKKRAALAIGFVFDHALSDDVEPLAGLLAVPLAGMTIGELLQEQVVEPLGRAAWGRHQRFDPSRLGELITGGEARSVAMRRKRTQPAATRLGVGVSTVPPPYLEAADDDAPPPWRYDGTIEIGKDLLGNAEEVDRLLEDLLEQWFDQIDVHTGVVVADASLDDACVLASAAGGTAGTEAARRAKVLAGASKQWGRRHAREPEWGTFLTLDHVEAVGGIDELESYAQPYRVLEGRRNVFVQLSPYDEALEPHVEAKRARLEAVLRPILAGPMSRE
jgi:hypothetical protein